MPLSPYYTPITQIKQQIGNEAAAQGLGLGLDPSATSLPPPAQAPVDPSMEEAPIDPTSAAPAPYTPPAPPLSDSQILQQYMRKKYPDQFSQGQDQADANRVTRQDIENLQHNSDLDAITSAASKAAAAAGSVGGTASKSNYEEIAKQAQLGDQNALKERMDLTNQGEDLQQNALKGLTQADAQDYQASLRPLELQSKQQGLDQGAQNLEKTKLGLASAQMDFRSKEALSDPDSPQSQALRQIAKGYGMKVTDDMTGTQLSDLIPIAEKAYNANENRASRMDLAQQRRQAQAEQFALKRESLQQNIAAKNDEKTSKKFTLLEQSIDPTKGRTGEFGKQQARINNADAIDTMIRDANGKLTNLTQTQIQELAIGINKMLGGSEAHGAIEALVPKNINMSAAGIKDWLTSEPNGTNQQKFVELMSHTLDRERALAQAKIKQAQIAKIKAYRDLQEVDPDKFATILAENGITPEQYKNGINVKDEVNAQTNHASQAAGTTTDKGRTLYVPGMKVNH